MEDTQSCPACGAVNPARRPVCRQCGRFLHQELHAAFEPATPASPAPEPVSAFASAPPQPSAFPRRRFLERPQVKIVRPSNRRKFLVGLLGSAAILGLGSPALMQLAQSIHIVLNTRGFPYDMARPLDVNSYSPDLNFMAMTGNGNDNNLYIWDYQRQLMTTLPANVGYGLTAWSPDNKYLLCQTTSANNTNALDMWDVQARRVVRSYYSDSDNDTGSASGGLGVMLWSPDGSRIALLSNASFVILDSAQLTRLFTFNVPANTETFVWSPDGQKLALLLGQGDEVSSWRLQIWNLRTRQMDTQALFPGLREGYNSVLAWSPDGERIAVLNHGQLIIIRVAETLISYQLNESNTGALAWSPDSRHLAVASNNEFCVWDSVEHAKVHIFNTGNMYFSSEALTWSKDGKSIRIIAPVYQQENWDWS